MISWEKEYCRQNVLKLYFVFQAKKEILDTELELISKQHAGDDTSDLRKKLDDLTREVSSL